MIIQTNSLKGTPMCFSVEASFGASAVLTAFGIAAVMKAKTPAQKFFALTPLIFAIQQFGEGIVWLSLGHSEYAGWQQPATYFFMIISQAVWPIWVPLTILFLEKEKRRKIILLALFGIGVFVSAFLLFTILYYKQDSNIGQHIEYTSDFQHESLTGIIFPFLYVSATVFPLLISSLVRIRILGFAVLFFSIVARVFYEKYEVSIWCFFAAMMSAMVCGIIYDLVNSETKKITVVTSEVKEIVEEKPPEQSATN